MIRLFTTTAVLLICWFPIAFSAQSLSHALELSATTHVFIIAQSTESFTQSANTEIITAENSAACRPAAANSYFRRFNLNSDHGITGRFLVTGVDFGVEESVGDDGVQQVTVNVYSIARGDAFQTSQLTLIDSVDVSIADGNAFMAETNLLAEFDADTDDLVVEVHEDGSASQDNFYIGSNALGQSSPSYVKAETCGISEITDLAEVGFPLMHIIMVVHGRNEPLSTDLSVGQQDTADDVLNIGDEFEYIVDAHNNGPDLATGVSIVNTLNDRVSYLSNDCGADVNGNLVTWRPGILDANEIKRCSIRVRVDHFGLILKSAVISGNETDPVPANDESTIMLAGPARIISVLDQPLMLILLACLMAGLAGVRLSRSAE